MEAKKEQSMIRLATYNIRNTTDRYSERKELLQSTIQDQNADIIGMQEVAWQENDQLQYLSGNLDKQKNTYDTYVVETQLKFHKMLKLPCKHFQIDGNATLVKKDAPFKVLKHETIHLSAVRGAQRLLIELPNGEKFWFVNTHIHHVIEEELIRVYEIMGVVMWMASGVYESGVQNVVLVGDFNAIPTSETAKVLASRGFKSSYKTVHGNDPEITFPTGIQAPHMDTDPAGCFDYLWYAGSIEPKKAWIFGDKAKEGDNTIYPSDHMGVCVEFVL